MTTETRYTETVDLVPRGSFYDSIGHVIPYRSGKTPFRLITETPNTTYSIFVNEINRGLVTTDSGGNAIFEVQLPLGDVILELRQEGATTKIVAYVTTRDYAVWHAAHATVVETIDDYIESTLKAFRLAEAGATDIDLAHGVRLITPNEFGADLETYREILQFMRQAFRHYGGRLSGVRAVVAAITQVNPLVWTRRSESPRWILGTNKLPNGDFQEAIRTLDGAGLAAEINLAGEFVSLISADSYVNAGTGILRYNKAFKRFIWIPPDITDFVPALSAPRYYNSQEISVDGEYVVKSGRSKAFLDSRYENPFPTRYPVQDKLYIDIDGHGEFDVRTHWETGITTGISELASAINAQMRSSGHYEAYRRVKNQPAGALAGLIEVIAVSDYTAMGVTPGTESGVGTIYSTATTLEYQSPTDASPGQAVTIAPGSVSRLYSFNGDDHIDVFVGHFILPPATDTFDIEKRYISVASTIATKIRLTSKNEFIDDGVSTIKISDGPSSGHHTIFGLDQRKAALQQDVNANDTQVVVPAGTMKSFSSVRDEPSLPFEVVIGRGCIDIPGTHSLLANPAENYTQAVAHTFSSFQVHKGITHYILKYTFNSLETEASTQDGAHPVVLVEEGANQVTVQFDGTGVMGHAYDPLSVENFWEVFLYKVDPSVPDHIVDDAFAPSIRFQNAGSLNQLSWQMVGSALWGPLVSITGGGYYRLYSHSSDGSKWLDVFVEPPPFGWVDNHNNMRFFIKRAFTSIPTTSAGWFWCAGERAIVESIEDAGINEIWHLRDPIQGRYTISELATGSVFEVFPFDRLPPYKTSGEDSFGDLTLSADVSEIPATLETEASIVVEDPRLPAGWIDRSVAAPIEFIITPEAKYYKGALLVKNTGSDVLFEHSIQFDESQFGYLFTFKVWARNVEGEAHALEFRLGFDFGSGIIESTDFSIADPNDTVQFPQLMEFSQILPADATQFKVYIRRTTGGSGPGKAIFEKAALFQEPFGSLFLGHGTIPRSGGRSSFGSLLHIWSPEELTGSELSVLGVDAPVTSGLLREIHNAHEQIDAFDVSDIVSGEVVNVRGVVDETDWTSATITNLEVVSRSPSKFSHVRPILPTKVEGETVEFNQVAPFVASLFFFSDENTDETIIYENGIPLPNDQWVYNTSTEIEILSGFVPGATYTVDYNRLTRIVTPAIDLETPPNNGNDTWFADYLVWNRHKSAVSVIRETASIFFNAAFEATLPRRSDASKLNSVLTEDIGTTKRIVPSNLWSYIDTLTVRIDGNEYNPDAIYNLEYNQQLTDPTRVVSITSEIRSANTAYSLNVATYKPFEINDNVDSTRRFHQIRLTFTNIIDVRDLRVYSAIIKGLNMLGAGSPPPGF